MDSFSEGLIQNVIEENSKRKNEFTDLDEIVTVEHEINRPSTSKQAESAIDCVDLREDGHTPDIQTSKNADAKEGDAAAAISVVWTRASVATRKGCHLGRNNALRIGLSRGQRVAMVDAEGDS